MRVKTHSQKPRLRRQNPELSLRLRAIQEELGLSGTSALAERIFHERASVQSVLNGDSSPKAANKIVAIAEMALRLEKLEDPSHGATVELKLRADDGSTLGESVRTTCRRSGAKAFRLSERGYHEWYPNGSTVVAYPVKSCSEGDVCMVLLKKANRMVLKRIYNRAGAKVMLCSLIADMTPAIEVSRNAISELLKVWSITVIFPG